MDVAQIKKEKDLEMQPPPGFTAKESVLVLTTVLALEDGSINAEDKKVDTSNSNAEEVAEDEDYYEQEPDRVDTDFYDFDRCKREECFESGHIWAIFGDLDVMLG
ncbi:hypothetical protein MKX03_036009 [Papaver bracteatum]|nr:hypothetical protein MKX03_036009 [Papaver bracteatum]